MVVDKIVSGVIDEIPWLEFYNYSINSYVIQDLRLSSSTLHEMMTEVLLIPLFVYFTCTQPMCPTVTTTSSSWIGAHSPNHRVTLPPSIICVRWPIVSRRAWTSCAIRVCKLSGRLVWAIPWVLMCVEISRISSTFVWRRLSVWTQRDHLLRMATDWTGDTQRRSKLCTRMQGGTERAVALGTLISA